MAITQTFASSALAGESSNNPTSITFGPDGRLYVSQVNGTIYAYDIVQNAPGDWAVTATETISLVQDIPNHNDDGALNASLNNRQVTGIVVEGTAANPVLYVSSSDPRIGAGGGGNDVNLDTNSGIISRLTWNGTSWDKLDLVIGLSRSEENHSTNGMDIREEIVDGELHQIMYVMSGGHDNKGAPSNNFAYTPEYYYSGAMLRIDLTQLEEIEANEGTKGGTSYVDEYVYALPTLDDPTRSNETAVTGDGAVDSAAGTTGAVDQEAGDTFGGNDGRNQAKFDPDGPVQVYSPGYRNAYDVVITEAGNIYTFDNGPNNGWGGDPVDDTGTEVTGETQVATNQPNLADNTNDGDPDNLHIVPPGTYGGHPNPTRASGEAAGLWSGQGGGLSEDVQLTPAGSPGNDAVTLWDDLPEDWSTITGGNTNPIEGVYYGPDNSPGPKDESLYSINSSSNGLTEYTATNIGDGGPNTEYLAVASFNGDITLMEIDTDGTAAGSTVTDTSAVNTGGTPLDLWALGNSGIPGSGGVGAGAIFVAQYGANNIIILEPGTPPGPDLDADNDGVLDKNDPLQYDPDNGTQTILQGGQTLIWDFNPAGGGVHPGPSGDFNIGMNGWMIDGVGEINPDVLIDNPGTDLLTDLNNTIRGGAPGVIQVKQVGDGDAFQGDNTQNDAIQTGFTPAADVETFTIKVPIFNPYSSVGLDQNFGSVGFALGDGSQSNYLKVVAGVGGGVPRLQVYYEEDDGGVTDITVNGTEDSDFDDAATNATGNALFELYLEVNPNTGTAQAFYNYQLSPTGPMVLAQPKAIGGPIALQGDVLAAVQGNNTIQTVGGSDLPSSAVVTLLSTSTGPETPFEANFAGMEITSTAQEVAPVAVDDEASTVPDQPVVINVADLLANDSDANAGDTLTVTSVGNETNGTAVLDDNDTAGDPSDDFVTFTPTGGFEGNATFEYTISDGTGLTDTATVTINVNDSEVLYRVNAGGALVAATDGEIDWAANTGTGAQTGAGFANNTGNLSSPGAVTAATSPSPFELPSYVPLALFGTERWDPAAEPEMEYTFDAPTAGTYTVNLFMADGFAGTDAVGARVFDISIEGTQVEDDLDLISTLGDQTAGLFTYDVEVSDGTLNILWEHVVENPLINAIEIIGPPADEGADTTPPVVDEIDIQPLSTQPGNDQPITVNVTLTDNEGVDTDSILATTLAVTGGPVGTDPTLVSISSGADGDPTVVAEYIVDAPDGGWPADTPYTFEVSGVADEAGNTVVAASNGYTFVDTSTPGTALYRVNVGGPELAAADGSSLVWSADTGNFGDAGNSPYLAENSTGTSTYNSSAGSGVPVTLYDPGIAASAPNAIFDTERFDAASDPEMKWEFPVAAGVDYVVNLFFAEIFNGITAADQRQFDISVEGSVPVVFDDVDPYETNGPGTGFMLSHTVTVNDDTLDLQFLHGIENPAIKGIEILVAGDPPAPVDSFNGTPAAGDDFSGDNTNPDNVTLNLGSNTLIANGALSDADYVTFEIQAGQQLTELNLTDFDTDADGNLTFLGIQIGDTMPTQAEIVGGAELNGGTVYGETQIGDDLLPLLASNTVENAGQSTTGLTLPLGPGEYTLWFNQNQDLTISTIELVTEEIPEPGAIVAAINAGGPALLQDGIQFEADATNAYFLNGTDFTDNNGGNGQQPVFDGTVYETERYGGAPDEPALGYEIDVAPGDYQIELYFAEIFQSAPGLRVFDVSVEGQLVADDLDILAVNGGDINVPYVLTVPGSFDPADFGNTNALDIDFSSSVDNAKISGIVVRDVSEPEPTGGAATLAVNNDSNNIQISNYGNGSFVLTNSGDKDITSFTIDVTNALYPDSVFDPFGVAGDLTSKAMTITGGSGTGVMEPTGGFYIGAGGVLGFEGVQLDFDPGTDGGFNPGETVAFAVDMDPNSIAGALKGTLDSGADPAGWDIGGISGAELIGSSFTVAFDDGTSATGQLQGQTNAAGVALQGGSEGLASQDTSGATVDLSANGLTPGGSGTYSDAGPQVIVNGPAGATARVVLTMGFIQPGENNFPDTTNPGEYHDLLDAQLGALSGSAFPANNAVDFQSVDILLTGADQDISSMFDFSQVVNGGPVGGGGWNDDVEGQLPLGLVASVIDTANGNLPVGPVTDPIYLTYAATIEADLSLSKDVSDPTPVAGETVSFTLTVDNAGGQGATGVTVEDILPGGFGFVGAAGDGSYDETTGLWSVGSVAAGDSATLNIDAMVLTGTPAVEDEVLFRINSGGSLVTSIDDGPDWDADQNPSPSPYLVAGGENVFGVSAGLTIGLANVPNVPGAIFANERWDPVAGDPDTSDEMQYEFEVDEGTYTINLYMAEGFSGNTEAGDRVFDVAVEGIVPAIFDDIDPFGSNGNDAFVLSHTQDITDGTLDLDFLHDVFENPNIRGIEIIKEGSDAVTLDYINYAQIAASDQIDPDSTPGDGSIGDDDDATISVSPITTADLELTKTVSNPAPAYGDTVTFTLTVDHADGVDATGVSVEDLLPDGFAYVSDTGGGAYDPGTGIWTVGSIAGGSRATLEITATVNGPITPEPTTVLYRVNAGGAEIAATDSGPVWEADTGGSPSQYLSDPGSANTSAFTVVPGATVPVTTPGGIFATERWDNAGGTEMSWSFDAPVEGEYEVRLYMGNGFSGTSAEGARVFDVAIEGSILANLDNIDLSADFGHQVGGMISNVVEVTDGTIDIDLLHDVMENPLINGIEIIQINDTTPVLPDYANYAQILTADQDDPDSIAGDGSDGDDDDASVVVNASALGDNVATISVVSDAAEPSSNGQFLVSLEDPVTVDTTITYTVDGTATNGTDYDLLSGSVLVSAGASSAPIDVTMIDDLDFEGDETVIVTLTGTSGGDSNVTIGAVDSATVTIAEDDPEDLSGGQLGVQITPSAGLDASTFGAGSFILTNESDLASGIQIASVSFDLSTGILPDVVFDPTGAGGDATASPFTPNSGAAATGLVVPGDPAVDPFSMPRNGGFDVIMIDFTDFDPGEAFTFTTDIDPNSIQGVAGAGAAGAVSGYELIGSTVTVTFTDGTSEEVAVGSLVHEGVGTAAPDDGGSLGGSFARIQTEDATPAPTLTLVGGPGDQVASLPGTQSDVNTTDFTLEVTGPANGTVDILQMDSRLFIASGNPPFGVSAEELPFYANEAMSGQVVATVQLDSSGVAQVPFSLLVSSPGTGPDGGVNHFVAVAYEPGGGTTNAVGLVSEPLVVKLGAPLVYNAPGGMSFDGTAGTVLELPNESEWQVPQGTVAFSFTADDTSGEQGLFAKDASFFGGGGHTTIYLDGTTLIARLQDTSTSAELSFDDFTTGEEYEIAVTFGPDGVALWVDGNLVDSDALPVTWATNTEYVQWGGRGWGSASGASGFEAPFNGQISDKQIYGEVLTASQIAALAATSSGSNTPPAPDDDVIAVDEDGSMTFDPLDNDVDGDGDTLSVSGIATQPGNGMAVVEADGSVTYTPAPDFNGPDSFEVTITDGIDSVSSAVVVTVNPVNDDPVAIADDDSTVVDTPVTIDVTANDIDVDGDTLDVVAVTQGTNGGAVTINPDGTVNYSPAGGFTGTDTFTYTIDDNNGGVQGTAEVTVSVLAAPNTPPVAQDDGVAVDEDGSVNFQPGANDSDADVDTVIATIIASGAANGTAVVETDGTVTYTPDPDFNGSDSFEVEVTDGNGGFDTSTVNVTVNPVNDPPEANDDAATTSEETAVIIDLLGNDNDIDGDALTIVDIVDPANGTVTDNENGTATYTPDAGFSGEETFTYTVTDGMETDTATVTVNVTSFPAPVVDMPGDMLFGGTSATVLQMPHSDVYEVPQGTLNFSFSAADTSGAQGLFSKDASGFVGGGNHFVVYLQGSTLIARFQDGANSATLTVPGIAAGQTYDVAAVFGAGGSELYVDGVLEASSPLVMDWTENVEHIQWGGRGWASASGAPGFDAPFDGTISNKQLYDVRLDATQIAELHADGPVNNAPVAVDDVLVLDEDTPANLDPTINDSDLDGDTLGAVSIAAGPSNGSAVVEGDGTVIYTPDPDYSGADSFDIVIGDGNGGFDTSTVDVTVNPVDDDPVANDDAAATQSNVAVVIDVLANDFDADGDTLSVAGPTDPSNGTVDYNGDGTLTYTPDSDFVGLDTFEYTLSDGDGPTDTATVSINVSDAPTLPVPVFELGGVNGYDGASGAVDNFAPDPALNIPDGTIAFSFIDDNPGVRQGLVVKDASGYVGGGNHFAAYIDKGDLKVRFQDGDSQDVLIFENLVAGQEYEVAAVFSSSGAELFVDGVQEAQSDLIMDWTSNGEYLQVGGLGWGSATGAPNFTNPLSGQIADVQIFDEVLSPDEILILAEVSSFDMI